MVVNNHCTSAMNIRRTSSARPSFSTQFALPVDRSQSSSSCINSAPLKASVDVPSGFINCHRCLFFFSSSASQHMKHRGERGPVNVRFNEDRLGRGKGRRATCHRNLLTVKRWCCLTQRPWWSCSHHVCREMLLFDTKPLVVIQPS